MKKRILLIIVAALLVISIYGCRPVNDISYIDEVNWSISWSECDIGRGGILTDKYREENGVIYVDDYYAWFGSIKGWVHQDGSIIIKSSRVVIRKIN